MKNWVRAGMLLRHCRAEAMKQVLPRLLSPTRPPLTLRLRFAWVMLRVAIVSTSTLLWFRLR